MGKHIGKVYKHSQSQISTSPLKAPVSSYSESQTSSAIELTTTYVPSARNKHQNNFVYNFQNTIQNDSTITNNDKMQYCEKQKNITIFQPFKHLIVIQNLFLPHPQVD